MKKILVILILAGLTFGASAQKFRGRGGYHYAPRLTVVAPYALAPYYGLGLGFGYSPFYNPYYPYSRFQARPSQLDLQVDDIKNDYSYQISTVRHDKSLPKAERKQKVRDLKHEREDAINDAKKSYYADKARERDRRNEQQ